jgi:tRNA pseudouridine13 synthase
VTANGRFKQTPEDFEVEEIPAYAPNGEGEHLFLWIEKRGVSAEQLTRHIAETLGIKPHDVGMAGLKDRQAVTRQYVSVPAKLVDEPAVLDTDAIRVLRSARHANKLKTGHLRGNRFEIVLRDTLPDAFSQAEAIAARLRQGGFPNYFGEQRFGSGGETLALGLELLRGTKTLDDIPRSRRKFLPRLALSAVQSWLFNEALSDRLRDGLADRVLPGDVMQVVASGGPFVAEDVQREQQRCGAGETAVSGPLFGPKMRQPTGEPAQREAAVLTRAELPPDAFRKFPKLTMGTRRPYLVRIDELSIEPHESGLRFRFTLPSGVYATTLLREFQK